MDLSRQEQIFKAQLSDSDFNILSKFIYEKYGIKMPQVKKVMLQSRLQKRLRALDITTYKEYINYVFSKDGEQGELIHMIDVVTTNKTDFFREPAHFDILNELVLPEFIKTNRANAPLHFWSAGCSSGEEPYTLAIIFEEFKLNNPNFSYQIFASDLSTRILEKAMGGIYAEDRIEGIPMVLKKRYFLRSKDKTKKLVRIVQPLRNQITYKRINFMDSAYDAPKNFDIIFCRNVLIYFDRQTQENVINGLCRHLKTDGYFFLGHSESTLNLKVPLKQIKPTVYRKI